MSFRVLPNGRKIELVSEEQGPEALPARITNMVVVEETAAAVQGSSAVRQPGEIEFEGTSVAVRCALEYLDAGWSPIPLYPREKRPVGSNWQKTGIDRARIAEIFHDGCNVGVLLGEVSNGLVDVDLDSAEALKLADAFLPRTDATFGRSSRARSHRLYRCSILPRTERFKDRDSVLLELRSTGSQTMMPPSVHPSGEGVRWDVKGKPTSLEMEDLALAVKKLAAASLLARHYPAEGARHEFTLAIAGVLIRAGWKQGEAEHFIREIARAVHDEEANARADAVRTTIRRVQEGQPATGLPRLGELLDPQISAKVAQWLGLGAENSGQNSATLGDEELNYEETPKRAGLAQQRIRSIQG